MARIIEKILNKIGWFFLFVALLVGFSTHYLHWDCNLTYADSFGMTIDLLSGDSPTSHSAIPKGSFSYFLARSVRVSGLLILPTIIGIFISNIQKRIEQERQQAALALADLTESITQFAFDLDLTREQQKEFVTKAMEQFKKNFGLNRG